MTGLEPATFGATSRRSNRLSYTLHANRARHFIAKQFDRQARYNRAEVLKVISMFSSRRRGYGILGMAGLLAGVVFAAPPEMNHKTDLALPAFLPVNASGKGLVPFADLANPEKHAKILVEPWR